MCTHAQDDKIRCFRRHSQALGETKDFPDPFVSAPASVCPAGLGRMAVPPRVLRRSPSVGEALVAESVLHRPTAALREKFMRLANFLSAGLVAGLTIAVSVSPAVAQEGG